MPPRVERLFSFRELEITPEFSAGDAAPSVRQHPMGRSSRQFKADGEMGGSISGSDVGKGALAMETGARRMPWDLPGVSADLGRMARGIQTSIETFLGLRLTSCIREGIEGRDRIWQWSRDLRFC